MELVSETHDLIVIGASAGGVETLRRIVGGLPRDLPAAVCVVLHIAPSSPSALASILQRAGALPCRAAADGEQLKSGQILVAPPDRHLAIEDGHVRLTVGPRENGHRPAVDVLFRTAAAAWGGRVIGVILSGNQDDGSAGMALIKARGGMAVVQDPREAMYAGMPANAIATVEADAVVASDLLADTLVAMVNGRPAGAGDPAGNPQNHPLPAGEPANLPPANLPPANLPSANQPVTTICPDCGGVLSEIAEAGVPLWECRVGHRYSATSLLDGQAGAVEAALWAAVRALEDRHLLLERMAKLFTQRGQDRLAAKIRGRAGEARLQAQSVRDALAHAASTSLVELESSGPGHHEGIEHGMPGEFGEPEQA